MGLTEPYNPEQARWQVRDLQSPDATLGLSSSCLTPGDIVAPPRFLPDGNVVVARFCPTSAETGDVVVEQVDLIDGGVVWSSTVAVPLLPSYSNTLDLSVIADDGTWVIVSGSDVETPTTSILIHGDQQLDISHPDFAALAFSPDELVV